MNRFFLSPSYIVDNTVSFPSDIAHQILRVLRLGKGEQVEVLDNLGHIYYVSLEIDSHGKNLIGRVNSVGVVDTEPRIQLSLCFGLSNREKVELILQKGTEIGVSCFYPFVSSRTLVQSTLLSTNKRIRWEKIIREAAEQSRRGRLPILHEPVDWEQCLGNVQAGHNLCLLAWECAEPQQDALEHFLLTQKGESIAVMIGPEGGFSEGEVHMARSHDCKIISLGTRILRMETAAIIFPALILHEVGEL